MRYHFSGIAGAGMNPLARLMAAWGHAVQGSDRSFDQGHQADAKAQLEALGITVVTQDGAHPQAGVERFIYSAAVEPDTPEVRNAERLGIERLARPALLAEVVNGGGPGVAISGTSGKSTTSGMVHWILRDLGIAHTALGGAALADVGGSGCFQAAPQGAPVVAEACESDGTLVGYRAGIGLIHNITRDHGELDELRVQFRTFARQARTVLVNAGCAESLAASDGHPDRVTYGLHGRCDLPLEILSPGPHRARGVVRWQDRELDLDLPQPGAHNLENACAALAVAIRLGADPVAAAASLARFPGVFRRFQVVGTTDTGIRIVDDYAHNGDKIRAAVQAAQAGGRVIAVFQPHGFGPARFLRPELKELWPRLLRPQDRLAILGIFYAGGTVAQDISGRDLAQDADAHYAERHADLLPWIAETAQPGDTVLIMGARDPRLPALARAVHELL